MANFDPSKLAAAKASIGPQFDPQKLQQAKGAMDGGDVSVATPQTLMGKAMEVAKDNAGAIIGSVAAGAATGGMSLAPSLAVGALGAGGGEAFQQIIQRMRGSPKAPQTPEAAMRKIAGQGLNNILGELGIKAGGKVLDGLIAMAPDYAFSMLKMPAEAVKRAISRLRDGVDIIPTGPEMKSVVEKKAIDALSRTQDALMESRSAAGHQVGMALESLQKATKGGKIFDIGSVAQKTLKFMQERFQTTDPVIMEAAKKDLARIGELLNTMGEGAQGAPGVRPTTAGLRDAITVNRIKQVIQGMTDFSKRGLPEIETELGQTVMANLGHNLREMISETAEMAGHKELQVANKEASAIYDLYEQMRPMLSTTKRDAYTMLRKLDSVARDFHAGGLRQELLRDVGEKFPHAAKAIDALQDHIAARAFTEHSPFTPSPGMGIAPFLRSLVNPSRFGKILRAGVQPGPIKAGTKMLTRAGAIMSSPVSAIPSENLQAILRPPEE